MGPYPVYEDGKEEGLFVMRLRFDGPPRGHGPEHAEVLRRMRVRALNEMERLTEPTMELRRNLAQACKIWYNMRQA